jgi:uroporphyrinogen decarboxylase
MAATGAAGLEVDYQHDIAYYRRAIDRPVCLQGNIAPASVMYRGTPTDVENAARTALEQGMVGGGRLILSAGCEIPRDTPAANLHALVDSAKRFGQFRTETHIPKPNLLTSHRTTSTPLVP